MEHPIFPTTKKAAEKAGDTYSSQENRNARFPTRLRELREKANISQKALSDRFGISKSTLGLWETGDTLPDAKMVSELADFFGVSSDYLLCRTETASVDFDIRAICEMTGLSEEIVKFLVLEREQLKRRFDSSYMEAFNDFFTPVCMQEILAHLWTIRRSANSLKKAVASLDDIVAKKEEFPIYEDSPYDNLLTNLHGLSSGIRELRLERFEAAEYLSIALDSAYKISKTIKDVEEAIETYRELLPTLYQSRQGNN